jgi:hypothetical protein
MYRHHERWGWGGGWGHPRWGWGGGPFIERRIGYPLLGGIGMGGLGWGGGGGGLIGDLLAGGVGYLVGKNAAQNQSQYQQYPQYQPNQQQYPQYPQYQPNQSQYQQYQPNQPQYQQYPQYQPNQQQYPQYQPSQPQYQPAQGSANSPQDSRLAQLNLLGQLRAQGMLTDAEFQAEKQKILNGS